ncbi:MAG: hypothetical protein V1725_04930 [archaeon]
MKWLVLICVLLIIPVVHAEGTNNTFLLWLSVGLTVIIFLSFLAFILLSGKVYHAITLPQLIAKYDMSHPDKANCSITTFVKEAHLNQHGYEDIRAELVKLGWAAADIMQAFKEIRIDDYIADAMEKGETKTQLQEQLLQAGWSSDQVKGAFERCLLF